MWRVADNQAQLELPQMMAALHLDRPQMGVAVSQVTASDLRGTHMMQILAADDSELALQRTDTYLRGTDLIACYENTAHQVRLQVYWRALPATEHAIGGVELVVSVNTECWVREPRLQVGSQVRANEVRLVTDHETPSRHLAVADTWTETSGNLGGALLYRSPEQPTFLEMIDPGEYTRLTLAPATTPDGDKVSSRFRVFEDRLEKGVIRRVRLRGLFLPRQSDTTAALACYRAFRESELPLTV